MTTYNTGNPLGSSDPRDLYDNAENLDSLVNGDQQAYNDRFGQSRKSWKSVEDQVAQQATEFNDDQLQRANEFDAAQDSRSSEFAVAQSYRASQYISAEDARNFQTNEFIANHGNYVPVGDYASGITLTQYNQVVRDNSGEFWRASGSTTLPYTTTGAGLPEGGVFVPVGDSVLRQQLAQDNGYRLVANQMAPNAYGTPGKLTNLVTLTSVAIQPCGYFDELLWGRDTSNRLHSSSDMGTTWTLVSSAANRSISQAFRTSDGEVLVHNSTGISKSSGWAVDPSSATWSTVLSRPVGNVADFLKWGVDGDGQKFIATHYSSTRSDSRYVWISTDAGNTWNIVWDSNTVDPANDSHLHAACYDPWAGRFYFTEGHSTLVGIYYSDDDGANWTKMTTDTVNGSTMEPAFTTMTATDFGIVCGTDGSPNGVWLIRRTANPDDVGIEFMGQVSKLLEGVQGFFDHSFRDPDTGIVYLGFGRSGSLYADIPNVIMACGAAGASIIYTEASNRVFSVFAAKGKIVAQIGVGTTWLRADTSKGSFYGDYLAAQDRGNLGIAQGEHTRENSIRIGLTASATGLYSVSIGRGSEARAQYCISLGLNAESDTDGSIAVGYDSSAINQYSVAVGRNSSSSGSRGVSIGYASSVTSTNGVSIGQNSSAGQGIALGSAATSSGSPNSIALGQAATASGGLAAGHQSNVDGSFATAVGGASSATTTGASAFGHEAAATGVVSTALGRGATSPGADSVAVGGYASAAYQATAVGRRASAIADSVALGIDASGAHSGGVAIGNNTATQRNNSVCVGNRDIESTRDGGRIYLKSPDGTLRYISINNAGEITVTTA